MDADARVAARPAGRAAARDPTPSVAKWKGPPASGIEHGRNPQLYIRGSTCDYPLKSAKELIAFATHIDNKLGFKLAMLKRANTAAYAAAVAAVSAVTSDSDSPPSEEDGSPSSDPDDGGGGGSSSMTGEEVAEGEQAHFRACVDDIFDGTVSRYRRLVPPSARAVVLTAGAPSPTRGRKQLALVLQAFLELCSTGVTTLAELGLPDDRALPEPPARATRMRTTAHHTQRRSVRQRTIIAKE